MQYHVIGKSRRFDLFSLSFAPHFPQYFFEHNMENNEIVKSSDITIRVGLNAEQVPTKIEWGASDRNNST